MATDPVDEARSQVAICVTCNQAIEHNKYGEWVHRLEPVYMAYHRPEPKTDQPTNR